jgi:hypothetical protein
MLDKSSSALIISPDVYSALMFDARDPVLVPLKVWTQPFPPLRCRLERRDGQHLFSDQIEFVQHLRQGGVEFGWLFQH